MTGWIAAALALIGCVQIALVIVYWRLTHELAWRFPHFVSLACIGGAITLFGALCFAIAFMLGA